MKKSVGVLVVVVLVAVSIVGVVFAGVKSSEKSGEIGRSAVTQQAAKADEKSDNLQGLGVDVSPEPCLMILIGVGGLIVLIGKKHRRRRSV